MGFHRSSRCPTVFYGWWIVAASFVIALCTGGVVFYGFTATFHPLAREFGWSYAEISFAASIRGMEMGLLAPLVGMLADRYGPRRLVSTGIAVTCLGFVMLSHTTSLAMFYASFVLIATGMSTCTTTALTIAIANWFRRRIGTAAGIMACGYGLGGVLVPVVAILMDSCGWRTAMNLLAAGILTICLPLSLFIRHKPEPYGCSPDGEPPGTPSPGVDSTNIDTADIHIGARQALKTATFWHITLALTCQSTLLSAVITHVMPYLGTMGVPRVTSSLIAGGVPIASIAGRLGLGALGDRLDKRRVAVGGFALVAAGLLCFACAPMFGTWLLVPFLLLFGVGYGGNFTLRVSLVREHFGRQSFGTINGFMMGVLMVGTIAGPPLAGLVFDTYGTYVPVWYAFIGLAIAALFLVSNTPNIRRPVLTHTSP